jgi:DNA ligase (NAD+)
MPRNTAKEIVESLGGSVLAGTTAKATYVVAGSDPGYKLDKARVLGIAILTEDEFLKLIGR